jgi:CRISPR-associated exonuclease Cas4
MCSKIDELKQFLPLSGIQHFAFCPRQWALIHIEGLWVDNILTVQGNLLHDKVDNPWFNELRKDMIISRSMPVLSKELGLQGIVDIVELTADKAGVPVPGKSGLWSLRPIEYKRGKPKDDHCDAIQLCAQAMCLEEMLNTQIAVGDLFYGQIRRRTEVEFSERLRDEVCFAADTMHRYFDENYVPLALREKKCRACSLVDVCVPELFELKSRVTSYIAGVLGGGQLADTD